MENQDIANLKLLITIGILITLFLATAIILFVVYYQRKMILKEVRIKLMDKKNKLNYLKHPLKQKKNKDGGSPLLG